MPDDKHKDDKGEHKEKKEEKKKTLWDWLLFAFLALLAIAVFFIAINPILELLFGGASQAVNTTGEGMKDLGQSFLVAKIGAQIMFQGVSGFIILLLLLTAFLVAIAWLVDSLIKWYKSSREEGQQTH